MPRLGATMAEHSTIEWTDATWSPITGCTLVSEGCRHCYAAGLAATRLKHHPSRVGLARINAAGEAKFTGEVRFNEEWLDQPLRWRRPRRIFVCAHGDLFHESVPDEWIDKVFAVMALASQHTFQVLTKRPERMAAYFAETWQVPARPATWVGDLEIPARQASTDDRWHQIDFAIDSITIMNPLFDHDRFWTSNGNLIGKIAWPRCPLPNVWLGTSAEDQATADERIPHLLATPAAVRFLSAEPLLGDIQCSGLSNDGKRKWNYLTGETGIMYQDGPDFEYGPRLDWVIVGGESGRHARPMHPDWALSLRDQCVAAGVPFFFKQWGEWAPGSVTGPNERSIYSATYWDGKWDYVRIGRAHPDDHRDEEADVFRVGKKAAGRLLDGREWSQMPGVE